ncbi:cytochrome P450 [Aspergillus bertholletiae]|uniref:Cytochrome P450 n=1 Tax=Aspergillus bertholletiae TaxID=1226010 RepID=A0A5N7BPS3_9EURO|nr:cytochrome P450 [Aspergillus bertholletiae]
MLQDLIATLAVGAQSHWAASSVIIRVGITVLATWLCWRIWRFTILPLFRPNEPVELPYWIPYFAHAGSFFKDSHQLVRTALKRFGTQEPFCVMIAGERYYFITSPADTRPFFADVQALTTDGFLDRALLAFGCAPERLHTLWQRNTPTPVNPKGKNLIHLTQDLFKHDLVPGPTFDLLLNRYQGALDELLSWDRLVGAYPSLVSTQTEAISLYDICADFIANANQIVMYDRALLAIDPDLAVEMRLFTDELWKLVHRSRLVNTTEVTRLLRQYSAAFKRYLQLPPEARQGEMPVIRTLLETYAELDIHEDDRAAMLVMVCWAGDANAYKAAFWVLAYILYDPQLREIIREETAPAVGPDGKLDWTYLAKQCPRISSVYHEVLRLTKRDVIVRQVVRDTAIAGKRLRKNSIAVIPTCQLHDNPETYGTDAASFNPDRFLKQPGLAQSTFFPYGGGRHYCPGRYFVALEIFGLAALLLNRYEMELAWPAPFPRRDESLVTLGISRPVPGDDLHVTLNWKEEKRG